MKWFVNEENIVRKSKHGSTPLHSACHAGKLGTVKEMLAVKGGEAALNMERKCGQYPIDNAKEFNHQEIVAFLEKYDVKNA